MLGVGIQLQHTYRHLPLLIIDIFAGNSTLEVLYLSGKFSLLTTYMKNTTEPHNFDRYSLWIRDEVVSQPLLFLNQLVFGCLEAYFQFKLGVKSSDTDLMMGGLLEAEKIFFFNRSNKNYQQAAAYRVSDLIKMPAEMTKLKLKYQTTDATLANSFNLPGHICGIDTPLKTKNET